MSFATELSNKIIELQYNTLPADAVHWAKVGILDTVGVTIAGAAEDATRIVLGVSGSSSGPSLVFGHARRIGAFVVDSAAAGSFSYTLPPPLPTATTASNGTATLVQRLTVPETTTVSGYSTVVSRFVSYACVVTPVDHDGSVATPRRWWGQVTLNANSASAVGTVWQIGTGSDQYKVCRDSADYNANGAIANSEHPLWYRGVIGALDSQNFLVIDRSENCPTDRPQDLLGNPVNLADKTTARHQPASYAELSFQCPAGGCGTKNFLEPAVNTTDLAMD